MNELTAARASCLAGAQDWAQQHSISDNGEELLKPHPFLKSYK